MAAMTSRFDETNRLPNEACAAAKDARIFPTNAKAHGLFTEYPEGSANMFKSMNNNWWWRNLNSVGRS